VRVLFLCSGNICRSPMADAYLRHRGAAAVAAGSLSVESAGTLGIQGASASAEAVLAMEEIGVDLSPHRSRGLSEVDLDRTDLIVGMDEDHLAEVRAISPGSADRCRLLRAFENGPGPAAGAPDLEDPIGTPLAFYRRQLALIVRCVDHLADHLEISGG